MKTWLLPLSFAICSFAAGLACALYVSKSLRDETWEEMRYAMNSWQYDVENAAVLDLHGIEAAERGDLNTVIRTNCIMLRAKLRGLNAEAFNLARQSEVRAFLEKARDTVARLESQSLCSFPAQTRISSDTSAK